MDAVGCAAHGRPGLLRPLAVDAVPGNGADANSNPVGVRRLRISAEATEWFMDAGHVAGRIERERVNPPTLAGYASLSAKTRRPTPHKKRMTTMTIRNISAIACLLSGVV